MATARKRKPQAQSLRYRSAVTGRFVTRCQAKKRPATTVGERRRKKR